MAQAAKAAVPVAEEQNYWVDGTARRVRRELFEASLLAAKLAVVIFIRSEQGPRREQRQTVLQVFLEHTSQELAFHRPTHK